MVGSRSCSAYLMFILSHLPGGSCFPAVPVLNLCFFLFFCFLSSLPPALVPFTKCNLSSGSPRQLQEEAWWDSDRPAAGGAPRSKRRGDQRTGASDEGSWQVSPSTGLETCCSPPPRCTPNPNIAEMEGPVPVLVSLLIFPMLYTCNLIHGKELNST